MQQIISSHLEASKIGQQVAERAMELQRRGEDVSSAGNSLHIVVVYCEGLRYTFKNVDNSPLPSEARFSNKNQQLLSSGENSASGGERPPVRYVSSHHQSNNTHHPIESHRSTQSLTALGATLVDNIPHQGLTLN